MGFYFYFRTLKSATLRGTDILEGAQTIILTLNNYSSKECRQYISFEQVSFRTCLRKAEGKNVRSYNKSHTKQKKTTAILQQITGRNKIIKQ